MNGRLLIWIDLLLPKYSAMIPDRMEPTGLVITPKLAENETKTLKLVICGLLISFASVIVIGFWKCDIPQDCTF